MTPTHHPGDDLLVAYAAGTLDEAPSVVVATHLALCPACRTEVARLEAIGGALLEDAAPAALRADRLDELMACLDDAAAVEEPASRPAPAPTPPCLVLPEPLRSYVGRDLAAVPWKPLLRGVDLFEIPIPARTGAGARTRTRLMRIRGGTAVPQHTHCGTELTLVLAGGFRDETGSFRRGDLAVTDQEIDHRPVADPGEDCICVAVTDAPLRLTGRLGRLLNPFVRF